MKEAAFLFTDGKMVRAGQPLISPDNRSFRYGDGFFETMQLADGKIRLSDLHFERLFASLELMQFQKPAYLTPDYLQQHIVELAQKNHHHTLARVRLTIYRGDGGLYDAENHFPHHLVQTWELNPSVNTFNENGLVLDIFKDARKVCDGFSHVKSNNYLPYTMAAIWAKQQKLNDALLLNPYDRIVDATIANVFIVKDGLVKTPALNEGCVSGVMRKHVLQYLRRENMPVEETQLEAEDVLQASEVFLTNAMYGIKWVKQVGRSEYPRRLSSLLHRKVL